MSIQSNQSGLRIAEELLNTPKTLPAAGVTNWEPVEPNSYKDFGAEIKTTAREPIAADRQNRKGSVTDLDAMAGFTVDFTTRALLSTIQGFMFASWRKKTELSVTATTSTAFTVPSGGGGFSVNDLVYAEDLTIAANNGVRVVTAATGTSVTAAGLAAAGSQAGTITRVGFQFTAADVGLTVSGTEATLAAVAKNLTQLGLIPGEWVWLGGDAAIESWATAANNGFYRVKTIASGAIVFDRIPTGAVTDVGTGKTIRLYSGNVLKNEAASADQVFRTYQAERKFASDKFEYILGMAADQLKIEAKTADKLTAELDFVALDSDVATTAEKAGNRPALKPQTAFSTSSDFSRLRLFNTTTAANLATYLTDLSLTISNGIEVDKALGSLGGVGFSIGNFSVSGSVEAYFTSMEAVSAVKANTTIGLDFGLVANVAHAHGTSAQGWLFDIPSITVGDARLKVEKNKKVKLPLSLEANADSTLNHTLLIVHYPFLPAIAL